MRENEPNGEFQDGKADLTMTTGAHLEIILASFLLEGHRKSQISGNT